MLGMMGREQRRIFVIRVWSKVDRSRVLMKGGARRIKEGRELTTRRTESNKICRC